MAVTDLERYDIDTWPERMSTDPMTLRCLRDNGVDVADRAEVIKALTKLQDERMLTILMEAAGKRPNRAT